MLDTLYHLTVFLSFGALVGVCSRRKNVKFDAIIDSYVKGCAKVPCTGWVNLIEMVSVPHNVWPILAYCSISIPPENVK